MATMDASQVTVGSAKATGAIWVAPENTTLPTDATTTLSGSFKLLGFTSDAGVQIAESRDSEKILAWEGRTEVVDLATEYYESVSFMPIQVNDDVAKLTWGSSAVTVDGSGNIAIAHHGEELDPVVIVIETTPRTGIIKRYTGTFKLSERGEMTMDGTQVDGRQLTFNSIAEASTGVTMHEYIAFVTGATGATS